MGNSENASQLLNYWIGQHGPDFDAHASSSFEATAAHSIQQISVDPGICSCKLLVIPRLQNNYGTMNGGSMAALTCIVAGAALETLGARSGIVTSNSMHCLRAVPVGAVIDVIGRVCTGSPEYLWIDQHHLCSSAVCECLALAAATVANLQNCLPHLSLAELPSPVGRPEQGFTAASSLTAFHLCCMACLLNVCYATLQ